MPTAMVISPHADDAAAFCGGTIAKFAAEGWRMILVRVTDDQRDSVGLTIAETIARNRAELRVAAGHMGVAEVIDLDFETDRLADESETALRERFVRLFREHRPYAVLSFDPFGLYEPNMDHIRTAQAVEEAFWVARFDLHHPEHFKDGLSPFAVCEQWYFARRLPETTHVEDVTDFMDARVNAFAAHGTMVRNIINSMRLQLETLGRRVPMLDACMEGDARPLIDVFIRAQAAEVAREAGLPEGRLGEAFRVVRFGGLERMFQTMSEPIPGAPPPPRREWLDSFMPD